MKYTPVLERTWAVEAHGLIKFPKLKFKSMKLAMFVAKIFALIYDGFTAGEEFGINYGVNNVEEDR